MYEDIPYSISLQYFHKRKDFDACSDSKVLSTSLNKGTRVEMRILSLCCGVNVSCSPEVVGLGCAAPLKAVPCTRSKKQSAKNVDVINQHSTTVLLTTRPCCVCGRAVKCARTVTYRVVHLASTTQTVWCGEGY